MPRVYPLFSSSKGNSTFVGSSTCGILIDVGVTYKRLLSALWTSGLDISAVKAVFITHEHSDHISGLKMLMKNTEIPVYAKSRTLSWLRERDCLGSENIHEMSGSVEAAGVSVTSFETPHDTSQSCGYKVDFGDKTFGLCTDVGHITDEVRSSLMGCYTVLLESNYDEVMLKNGSYPYYLKQRIRSPRGHLSNDDCGKFSQELITSGATRLILGHLSQENNTPDTADGTVGGALMSAGMKRNRDFLLNVAPVETSGKFVSF